MNDRGLSRVEPADRAGWRRWLAEHHDDTRGVWLILHTKASGRQAVSLDEAVSEALCFGWIDSTVHRLGGGCSALLFTPRRPGSTWALSNKRRVESLTAQGLMTDAGLRVVQAAQRDGSWSALDAVESLQVPDDLARALDACPAARAGFHALPPSTRKTILWGIASAKRPPTRERRIAEAVRTAAATHGG